MSSRDRFTPHFTPKNDHVKVFLKKALILRKRRHYHLKVRRSSSQTNTHLQTLIIVAKILLLAVKFKRFRHQIIV